MIKRHFIPLTFFGAAALLVPLGCDSELLVGVEHPVPSSSGGNAGGEGGAAGPPSGPLPGLVRDIALGWYHDCAALSDGTVRCWGVENSAGPLGDGTVSAHTDPRPVTGLAGVTAVQASYVYSCAQSNGTTSCWGSDHYGQFGDGRSGTSVQSLVPSLAFDGAALAQLALGEYHACALLADGQVACTGLNSSGQLGDGTTTDHATLTIVPGLTNVTQVVAGGNFGCALRGDHTVACWGANANSDICSNLDGNLSPQPVAGITGVQKIAAGTTEVCALLADHTVSCWGQNVYGELGSPSSGACPSYVHGPQPVPGLPHVADVATGGNHTCALRDDGTVACWGYNKYGQLGDGTTTDRATPVAVAGLSGVIRLVAGYTQTCAVVADGTLMCWGAFPYNDPPPASLHPQPMTF